MMKQRKPERHCVQRTCRHGGGASRRGKGIGDQLPGGSRDRGANTTWRPSSCSIRLSDRWLRVSTETAPSVRS